MDLDLGHSQFPCVSVPSAPGFIFSHPWVCFMQVWHCIVYIRIQLSIEYFDSYSCSDVGSKLLAAKSVGFLTQKLRYVLVNRVSSLVAINTFQSVILVCGRKYKDHPWETCGLYSHVSGLCSERSLPGGLFLHRFDTHVLCK